MRSIAVRYKAKPEQADENERLIRNVFQELHAQAPAGFRYMVLRLSDGSFIHLRIDDAADAPPMPSFAAFKAFQSTVKDRCEVPPQQTDATVVGHYLMLRE